MQSALWPQALPSTKNISGDGGMALQVRGPKPSSLATEPVILELGREKNIPRLTGQQAQQTSEPQVLDAVMNQQV